MSEAINTSPHSPYPEYKSSDIQGIESIPSHWEIKPIKALTNRIRETGRPDLELLSVYRDFGVIPKHTRDDNFNKPSLELSNYQVVRKNNLVINKMKTWQGSLAVSEYEGIVSPAYIICKLTTKDYFPKYLHYLLRSISYIAIYASLSYGIRPAQWDMHYEDFRQILALLPPISEQRAIARFLDVQTAKIDALIAKKERLIELLEEKRMAIISQAVTKGLNPDVAMKESGVEWLGEIPANWDLKPLKHLLIGNLTNGLFKKKQYFGTGVKLVNVVDLYQDDFLINFEYLERVEATLAETNTFSVKPGDIFFVRSSLKYEGVGASVCILHVPEPTIFESHVVRARPEPSQIIPKYLIYFLNSSLARQRLIALAETTTMTTISQPKITSLEVAIPSPNHQQEIISWLDSKLSMLKGITNKIRESIQEHKEYRSAIISAAVTGKIDLRKWKA